jgi:RecA-family ATPase
MDKLKRKQEVTNALEYLHPDHKTFEVSAIKPETKMSEIWGNEKVSGSGIVTGWFHNNKKVADIVPKLSEVKPEGTYVSLNTCNKILEDRTNGKLKANITRTKDDDIIRYTNFLIDVDAKRPSGISSTDKEHIAAIKSAKKISRSLKKKGWPSPLMVDSGNGAQLIYKIDLKNTDQNKFLLKNILESLAQKFNSEKINIDTSVYNPSRLVRLPGTYNRKGEDSSKRPHRRARILAMPKSIKLVMTKRLQKLASTRREIENKIENEKPVESKNAMMDVPAYLDRYGIETIKVKSSRGGKMFCLKKCLFNDEHSPNKASIFQSSEGTLYYQCFHNSCRGKKWEDARKVISGNDKLKQFYQDLPKNNSVDNLQYSIWTGGELIEQRVTEKPLIKGLLEKSGSLLIIGQTGIMKSMLTLNIALNMAAPPKDGRLWSIFDITKPVRSLFIQSENSIFGTKNRLKLMVKGNNNFENALNKIFFPNIKNDCRISGDIRDEKFQNVLKDIIFKTKARLIVIDPFISFHNQDENANTDIRKVLDTLTELCHVTKVACVLVHHMGKTSSSNVFSGRGASALADWANNILILSKKDEKGDEDSGGSDMRLNINHVKSRNFRLHAPFTLEASGKLQFTKVDEPKGNNDYQVAVDVLESLGGEVDDQGTFKKALVKNGIKSDSTAGRLINKAADAGVIEEFQNKKKKGYRIKDAEGE